MGCSQSRSSAAVKETSNKNTSRKKGATLSFEDKLNDSIHSEGRTQRQNLAWHREGVPVTDVYDVLEIVGQGSMGEVTVVEKKVDAVDEATARLKDLEYKSVREGCETAAAALAASGAAKLTVRNEKRRFACKTVNTLRMKNSELLEFVNEIDILRDLDHPNIVQLFEVYKVKRKMWIIIELCSGGDLTSRLKEMNEADVVVVLEQILRAVVYMHKRNVCHRDIKLENVMYSSRSPDSPVKLIDFGLSNKFTKGEKMLKACGTIYTAAPELLLGTGYTEQTDIWSIGVVTWVLLTETYPFLREMEELQEEEKKENLVNARFKFGPEWEERKISNHAREFVSFCMRKHPGVRWSAMEALEYVTEVWIPYLESMAPATAITANGFLNPMSNSLSSTPQISTVEAQIDSHYGTNDDQTAENENTDQVGDLPSIAARPHNPLSRSVVYRSRRVRVDSGMLDGMHSYAENSELKKTILMTMAYTMDKSSLSELRDIFTVLDAKGTGTITLVGLKKALKQMHSDKNMDDATIEKLFIGIDTGNCGEIHYNEFLAAVVESQGLITMEHLADAFDRLDSAGKGYISKNDLQDMLGSGYNEDLVNLMMDEADYKKNGQIDYDEFLRLMFEDPTKGAHAVGERQSFVANPDMTKKLRALEPSTK